MNSEWFGEIVEATRDVGRAKAEGDPSTHLRRKREKNIQLDWKLRSAKVIDKTIYFLMGKEYKTIKSQPKWNWNRRKSFR